MTVETTEVETNETETEFKPMFLFHNKERYDEKANRYRGNLNNLNALASEAEKALDRQLTNKEKQSIAKGSASFVFDELTAKFPFPKATEQFNYEAMGVDIETLRTRAKACKAIEADYKLEDGIFIESEKYLDQLAEATKVYTTNERQNVALQLSKTLFEAYNEFFKLEFLKGYYSDEKKSEVGKFLQIGEGGKLIIHYNKILNL